MLIGTYTPWLVLVSLLVAALAGKAEHAVRHVDKGVDIVVAQGHEAGGHTGEIASMVLVPEIVDAVGDRVPVLAAGGTSRSTTPFVGRVEELRLLREALARAAAGSGGEVELVGEPGIGKSRLVTQLLRQSEGITILGGACVGRGFAARVLPGGADFQLVASATLARLEARYVLETEAGERIYVHNDALRTAAPEVMARLVRGEPVDPADVYFRCVPRFECAAPALAWIGERVFVGVGVRRPATVVMRFFEVL